METSMNNTFTRPWGTYTILEEQEYCKVKSITVNPGGKLSLQAHQKRAETWTMVSGIGTITIDNNVGEYKAGASVNISVGQKHRFENRGDVPAIFVEVQTGSYFGEDDIIRYADVYGRN